MSGVFGIVAPSHTAELGAMADRMARDMSHRDWYVAERNVDEATGIALGRIGIGIFNRQPQPIWNADHTIGLVMAGELYGTTALKQASGAQSDEALALWMYEHHGSAFVAELDGQFAIAVWDARQNTLTIANDRFGLYPTYFARIGRGLVFAPEVKAVLSHPNLGRELRDEAVAEFIFFQHLLGCKTFFRDVNMLPPASVMCYRAADDVLTIQPYWSLPQVTQPKTFDQAVEEVTHLVHASMAKMSQGQERTGVFLSGGLDGRMILGFAQHHKDVHTFTFGQHGCRDEVYARRLAKAVGATHHYYPYENGQWVEDNADFHLALTEGFHPFIHMHGIHMLHDVRAHVDVNLSGLGDLLWLQDNFAPRCLLEAKDDIAFGSLLFDLYSRKYTWPGLTAAEEYWLYDEKYFRKVRGLAFESFMTELRRFDRQPYPQRLAEFNLVNHFLRYIHNSAVIGRSHVEFRFPYFDPALMACCAALPYEIAEDRAVQKAIIVREMPQLAAVPTTDDELPLTNHRVRHAVARVQLKLRRSIDRYLYPLFGEHPTLYADYELWLRTDLRVWAEQILFSERTNSRSFFRREGVRSLVERHMSGLEMWTIGKIAPLITFEMMLRAFVDAPKAGIP